MSAATDNARESRGSAWPGQAPLRPPCGTGASQEDAHESQAAGQHGISNCCACAPRSKALDLRQRGRLPSPAALPCGSLSPSVRGATLRRRYAPAFCRTRPLLPTLQRYPGKVAGLFVYLFCRAARRAVTVGSGVEVGRSSVNPAPLLQDQQSRELSQGHVGRRAKRLRVKEEELKLPRGACGGGRGWLSDNAHGWGFSVTTVVMNQTACIFASQWWRWTRHRCGSATGPTS